MNEFDRLYEALRPKPEPPCDCQKCIRRHTECAEYKALNKTNCPYDREYCHWYLKES